MKRKAPEHENHERWLVSYADFITLLFAFFVVMFASSQTDKARAKRVSESISEALGDTRSAGVSPAVAKVLGGTVDDVGQGNAMQHGPGGAKRSPKEPPPDEVVELTPSLKVITEKFADEIKTGKLQVSLEPRGLVVSLRQAVFFPSGTDVIEPKTYSIVERLAAVLKSIPNPIRLEGHTDAIPIHTARFGSNWELSAARGIAMLKLLTGKYGIATDRCAVVGYGENAAIDSNESEEGRAQNRRVDVVIMSKLALQNSAPARHPKPSPAH